MLANIYRTRPRTLPGTRLLEATFDLLGTRVCDPLDAGRAWRIEGFYAPLGHAPLGLRAKLLDAKGFVTFCNQRDLEVLLGLVSPGDACLWAKGDYPAPGERAWCGLCCDDDDLKDDLFDRELLLRAQSGGILYMPLTLERRVHLDQGVDAEETWVFLGDVNYVDHAHYFVDTRFATLGRRWARAERRKVSWARS